MNKRGKFSGAPSMSEAEALAEVRSHVTVSTKTARALLRVGAEAFTRGVAEGSIPVIRLGREKRVPSGRLLGLLGLPVAVEPHEAPVEPVLNPSTEGS